MKRYILILIFSLSLHISTAQQPTPTPVGIVSMQGRDNTGQVQLLSIDEVIQRTGVLSWKESNWTGRNQRVGVLDQGFGQLVEFESANGISINIAPGGDRATYTGTDITHGTDVLSVIHAIAPDAELYACEYLTLDAYVSCIDWMIASDVNIINHSAGVPALPLDGTSRWAREVDRAARSGILWVNAAGNYAQGYTREFFNDNNLNTYHEFQGVGIIESLAVNQINQQNGRIMLSWTGTGTLQANEIDFDLEVINASNQIIASSTNLQSGNPGELALEILQVDMSQPFGVRVRNSDGQGAGARFALFVEYAALDAGESSESIVSPGDSASALTIGSLQGSTIAPYSSRGPIETGALKPDIVAHGEVILPSGRIFVGTSAAAPLVAGIAALVWEANPEWTRAQVYQYLRNTAQDDSEIPNADSVYGQGRVYLPQAQRTRIASVSDNTPVVRPTATQTQRPTNTPSLQPTATSEPVSDDAIITIDVESANLRDGPGTNYAAIDSASRGEQFEVVAKSDDWYLIDTGSGERSWVWSEIVSLQGNNRQIAIAETRTATVELQPTETELLSSTTTESTITVPNSSQANLTTEVAETSNENGQRIISSPTNQTPSEDLRTVRQDEDRLSNSASTNSFATPFIILIIGCVTGIILALIPNGLFRIITIIILIGGIIAGISTSSTTTFLSFSFAGICWAFTLAISNR